MYTNFNILVSLENTPDSDSVYQQVKSFFPKASVTRSPQNTILNTIAEQIFHIVIIDCNFEDSLQLSNFLNHLSTCSQLSQPILVLPDNKPEYIKTAIDHDIFSYLFSPVNQLELNLFLERAGRKCTHMLNTESIVSATKKNRFPGFIGECSSMQNLFELITRIADDDFATVLIRGESGTGKELVARAIHTSSRRNKKNFVPVNCAAIPDDLLESELFGHIKGSFTGATQSKQGRIQYADKGTLFLDEIGDMKPALQAKLLRVLQEKEFEPVGSLKAIPVDTRIVAATHCDLEDQVKSGQFREDLYYRLSVIPLEVPPLRKRTEDIPVLLSDFIHTYTIKRGRKRIHFTPQSIDTLMSCEWRGNVRELENLVQHMSILYSGRNIHPHDLPEKYLNTNTVISEQQSLHDKASLPENILFDSRLERAELLAPTPSPTPEIDLSNGPIDFNQLINEFEKELIIKAMQLTSGNKKEAARILNLKRTTLLEKIKKKELAGLW